MTKRAQSLRAGIALIAVFAAGVVLGDPGPSDARKTVMKFYEEITARHPLGIPAGKDREALWPYLSPRLISVLETAERCEQDYFEKNTCDDCKPEFWWLETGLFSGGEEKALPAEVSILSSEEIETSVFRVGIRFTYRETFATYGRPPDPANEFHWNGTVVLACSTGGCLVDDFVRLNERTGEPGLVLSRAFTGCDGATWAGATP